MTGWDDILKPAPVYCDGCFGKIDGDEPRHTEHLATPLGRCARITHPNATCIQASRKGVNGKPVKVRETGQDKINAHLRGKR